MVNPAALLLMWHKQATVSEVMMKHSWLPLPFANQYADITGSVLQRFSSETKLSSKDSVSVFIFERGSVSS